MWDFEIFFQQVFCCFCCDHLSDVFENKLPWFFNSCPCAMGSGPQAGVHPLRYKLLPGVHLPSTGQVTLLVTPWHQTLLSGPHSLSLFLETKRNPNHDPSVKWLLSDFPLLYLVQSPSAAQPAEPISVWTRPTRERRHCRLHTRRGFHMAGGEVVFSSRDPSWFNNLPPNPERWSAPSPEVPEGTWQSQRSSL